MDTYHARTCITQGQILNQILTDLRTDSTRIKLNLKSIRHNLDRDDGYDDRWITEVENEMYVVDLKIDLLTRTLSEYMMHKDILRR